MTMKTGQRRRNDPAGMRQKVVNAAYRAFTTAGYHATSVHDLKREAGVTGGALAHHFPSKQSLALAVLDDPVSAAIDLAWIRPMTDAATTAAGIRAVFGTIVTELEGKGRVQGCPLNNLALELAGHDAACRERIDALFTRWRRAVEAKLAGDGVADAEERKTLATLIVAAYSGAMAMAKAAQDPQPLRACAEQLLAVLNARGLAGSPSTRPSSCSG